MDSVPTWERSEPLCGWVMGFLNDCVWGQTTRTLRGGVAVDYTGFLDINKTNADTMCVSNQTSRFYENQDWPDGFLRTSRYTPIMIFFVVGILASFLSTGSVQKTVLQTIRTYLRFSTSCRIVRDKIGFAPSAAGASTPRGRIQGRNTRSAFARSCGLYCYLANTRFLENNKTNGDWPGPLPTCSRCYASAGMFREGAGIPPFLSPWPAALQAC